MIARYGENDYGYSEAGYGYGVSAFTGFDGLDAVGDLLGWWSVSRRVLSRYSGPAIRLRRSSDSSERDFYGIGPQGEVSTADVRAWNGWNLLRHTDDMTNVLWSNVNTTVSSNVGANVLGQTSADLVTEQAVTGQIEIRLSSITVVSGATYTQTAFAKSNGRRFLVVRANDNASNDQAADAVFDLQALTVSGAATARGTWSNASASISVDSNGWIRCSLTFTTTSTSIFCKFQLSNDGTRQANGNANSYTGDGASGIIFGGVQLERASSFSTYEPRTTAAGDSFLVTLYDQSGLARHFTQSTTTLQPIICEQGVPVTESGRLAAKFVAADARRMSVPSSTAMFNALHTTGGSVLAVSKANNTAAVKVILRNKSSSNIAGFQLSRLDDERMIATAGRLDVAGVATIGNTIDVGFAGTGSTSQSVIAAVYDPDNAAASSRAFLWQNGSQSATTNASTGTPFVENAANDLTLGAIPGGASPFDGTISEVATFSSLISTADRTAWQSRSGIFYGVTIS